MSFKDKFFLLVVVMMLVSLAGWLGMASKPLPTNASVAATAKALSATPTTTEAPATMTATIAATATLTPQSMAETATAVARAAWSYKDSLEELQRGLAKTATREARWQEDTRIARKQADSQLRNAGCYERSCILVTWESGYDRWSSVVANGISVADGGNSIFLSKVSVSWDNYDRPERVVVKPSDRTTRDGEPYAVWVRITANGELQLTELPVEEIYGN